MQLRRLNSLARWTGAFLALAALLLLYRRWLHVNPTTVALTLVLLILVLAAQWELRYAVAMSFAAAAAYNFYFLPPLGTFTISDPQNWLALITFLATSIIGSRLSQNARDQAATALKRQRELEVLYLLSRELLQTENVADAVQSIPRLLSTSINAESSSLYLLNRDQVFHEGARPITAEQFERMRQMVGHISQHSSSSGDDSVYVPLDSAGKHRGLLALRGVNLTAESILAIGGLISITLDHAQAIETAAQSEANRESERLRTLIVDSITHELRTPLTSIKGAAGALLAEQNMPAADRNELVSIIDEEADRLNRLISQVVEVGRIENREVQMNLKPLSIVHAIENAKQQCAWIADGHRLQLDIGDVPLVMADRELLSKVLCNLLENAAKYSPASSLIVVNAIARGETLEVSVTDQGGGIDVSEQELIFARFYRSRAHAEGTPGTGMGLTISRAIMEAHGGSLQVTSTLGLGSTFTLSLPQALP